MTQKSHIWNISKLSESFHFKMVSLGQFDWFHPNSFLVNLKQLLKVRKATTSALKLSLLGKSQNVAFIPRLCIAAAAREREEQFKDYSKVEIVTKTKLHFSIFHHHMFPPESSKTKKSKLCSSHLACCGAGTKAVCVSCEISAAMLFSNLHRNAD